MKIESKIVVIGSGAGGATVTKELAKRGKDVLLVERGNFTSEEEFGDFRTAVLSYYDRCALRASKEGIIVYRAIMAGGTTVVSCGNAMRVLEDELSERGIDLSQEFEETEKELAIRPLEGKLIGRGSRLIMNAANRLGYEMWPMPKFVNNEKCTSCGRCVLGCKSGAKWTALNFVNEAISYGAKFVDKTDVKSVVIHKGKAIGVIAKGPKGIVKIYAKKVVLSAGGIGSPVVLQRSGIKSAGNKLFADFFNVTYGILRGEPVNLWNEPSMAVVSKKFLKNNGFILSSFIDVPVVLRWIMPKSKQLKRFSYKNLLGIMTKTKDEGIGKVNMQEKFEKTPHFKDYNRLNNGTEIAKNILLEAGVRENDIIFTKPRAAHPGGTASIGEVVDTSLETEIKNLYVCDASVLPVSPGAPPILTIVALGKRLSKDL